MTIGEWILCIILICFGLCIVGVSLITLILNTRKNETMLEMQINASKVHSTQHVETMKYEDYEWLLFSMKKAKLHCEDIRLFCDKGFDERLMQAAEEGIVKLCSIKESEG